MSLILSLANVFLIHVSNRWIYGISHVRPSVRPFCVTKNFNVEHYAQTFQPKFLIPAMLIGTTDFYNFMPLAVILILDGGHKFSSKQNLFA